MVASDRISPTLLTLATAIRTNPSNVGLRVATEVTKAQTLMSIAIDYQRNVINTAPSRAFANTISSASDNLSILTNRLYNGGVMSCLQVFYTVKSHLDTALEIKETSDRMANTNVKVLGSGITNMSSASTQGLGVLGNLTSVGNVIRLMGPAYNLSEMKYFGTGVGLVKKLTDVRMIRSTGVYDALIKNNVDLTQLEDPVYSDTIDATLGSITNSTTINSVLEEFNMIPLTPLTSLKDFTDINKFVPLNQRVGLNGGLPAIATKFNDLNAQFETVNSALGMLSSIQTPTVPSLDSASSNLTSLMASAAANVSAGTGASIIASDPRGIPNMTDFLEPLAGGSTISQVVTSNVSVSSITALDAMITRTYNLFNQVNIDIINSTTHAGAIQTSQKTLEFSKSLSSRIETIGEQDTTKSNAANVLIALTTSDIYGDSVKALLADGKNKAALSGNKVIPLRY